MRFQFPIVGAYFRPPAAAVLEALPTGAVLALRAEPENPYDPNAIQVLMAGQSLTALSEAARTELDAKLPNYGFTLEELVETPEIHLGYIPRDSAAGLRRNGVVPEGTTLPAEFVIGLSGKPEVRWGEVPKAESPGTESPGERET